MLRVRGKDDKWREVPLHPSTTHALTDYARLRDRHWPAAEDLGVLRLHHRRAAAEVGGAQDLPAADPPGRTRGLWSTSQTPTSRLRHSYAVATLLDWYRDGENVDAKLPLLCSMLGHAKPEHTYWYLQAVPELLELVAARLDGLLGAQS